MMYTKLGTDSPKTPSWVPCCVILAAVLVVALFALYSVLPNHDTNSGEPMVTHRSTIHQTTPGIDIDTRIGASTTTSPTPTIALSVLQPSSNATAAPDTESQPTKPTSTLTTLTDIPHNVSSIGGNSGHSRQQRRNVVFIMVDDLRPEMEPYLRDKDIAVHARIWTPHMRRLAESGVVLEHAYCQQAHGAPSRTSTLTSRRPDTTGIYATHDLAKYSNNILTFINIHTILHVYIYI